jgi:transposase
MVKIKHTKKKPAKNELSPPSGLAADRGEIRKMLGQLTAVNLEKLLRTKKVLGRSKLTRKDTMIPALEGLITADDLKSYNQSSNPKEDAKNVDVVPINHCSKVISLHQEVEGRRKTLPVLGMDIHKGQITYAVVSPEGLLHEGVTENTSDGISTLIQLYHNVGACIGAMESTAEYWLPVYWQMQDAGLTILVANAHQTKAIMDKKTDKFDARRIAFAVRDGILKPSVTCTREQFALRKNMRDLVKRDQWATSIRSRIQQIFDKAHASKFIKSLITSIRGKRILMEMFQCKNISDFFEVVKDEMGHHRGKIDDVKILRQYAAELNLFMKEVDTNQDRNRLYAWFRDYLDEERKMLHLQQEGLRYAQTHPTFQKNLLRLLEIPDVGLNTALAVLAEIVDVAYFPKAKGLAKWAGLVPKVSQSGYRKAKMGKLCRAGNKYLRRACWIAAQVASTHGTSEDHPIGRYINHLKTTNKCLPKVAITAGARKLLVIIHAVLNSSEPFRIAADPEVIKKYQKKVQIKQNEVMKMIKKISPQVKWKFMYQELKARYEEYHEEHTKFDRLWKQIMGGKVPTCEQ